MNFPKLTHWFRQHAGRMEPGSPVAKLAREVADELLAAGTEAASAALDKATGPAGAGDGGGGLTARQEAEVRAIVRQELDAMLPPGGLLPAIEAIVTQAVKARLATPDAKPEPHP